MKPLLLLCIIAISSTLSASAAFGEGKEERAKKDTVSAVVVYGDSTLLSAGLSLRSDAYITYLDSLLRLKTDQSDKEAQIRLIRSVEKKSEADVAWLIDSLFSVDEVPYALINEINLYIALLHERRNERSIFYTDKPHYSEHPAQCFYGSWNEAIPNPYKFSDEELDSTVYLKLRDSLQFCDYAHPHLGPVTSRFGWRYGRKHNGIDVDLEVWDPVHSAFAGQVRVAKYYGGYGRVVVVRHYNGLETVYAHLHRFKVEAGDFVEAGDVIGLGGSSGRSSGSHLHFEVRFKGQPVNPEHLISFVDGTLIGDTLILTKAPHWYAARTTNTQVHRVKKGEYLHKIATEYGVSMERICKLNGIRRNTVLRVGQRLRISG